jgi:hypothetical protein
MEMTAIKTPEKRANSRGSRAVSRTNPAQLGTPVTAASLQAWRKGLGLSRAKLAGLTGIAERRIEMYEYGEHAIPPYIDRLLRYFDRYGVLK